METNNSKSNLFIVLWVISFFVFGGLYKFLEQSMGRLAFLIVCSLLLGFTYYHLKSRKLDTPYFFLMSFIMVSGIFWLTALFNVFI